MSKFIVPTASPLKASVRHIFNLCKVPSASIVEEGCHFAVVVSDVPLSGLVPTFRCLQQDCAEAAAPLLGGQDRATQAIVQQWIILSQKLASGAITLPEVELLLTSSSEYLCDPKRAMAADIVFFNAARWATAQLSTPIPRTSSIAKWLSFAEKGSALKEFLAAYPEVAALSGVEDAVDTKAAAGAGKKGVASGFVVPNAEEIERRRLEKEKAKAEKEKAKAAAAASGEAPAPAAKGGKKAAVVEDSSAIDIRVGLITEIKNHPEAEKLYVETIDLGNGEVRTIVSGLVPYYKAEELLNQQVIVVYNMKPKALKGVSSEGMVLCAGPKEGDERVLIVKPPAGSKPGDRVTFGGKPVPTEKIAIPGGNKMMDLLAPLRTSENGTVQWGTEDAAINGVPIVVSDMTAAPVK